MVEQVGLEPTTTRLWAEGSNQLSYCSKWWLQGESNPRHSGYEPPALPTELRSQSKIDIKTELRKKQEETHLITINYAVSLKITLKPGPLQTKYKRTRRFLFLAISCSVCPIKIRNCFCEFIYLPCAKIKKEFYRKVFLKATRR